VSASGDVEGDAAETVAAHLWPRTVSVVHDHAGVGLGVWGNEKDSVGADAEVSVAESADEVRGKGRGFGVEEDEVVAEAVIFGEGLGHGSSWFRKVGVVRGSGVGLWLRERPRHKTTARREKMNDWWKRGLTLSVVAGAMAVGASACADNESSIFIRQVLVPSGSDCTYSADPGGAALALGVMDLAFTREYWAGLLVGNQLVARGASDQLRTETARFRAEGAEVEIETTSGDLVQSFTVPVSGFADPSGGTEPGWGVVHAVLIDGTTGQSLAAGFAEGERSPVVGRVVVVVKVFGRTLGGREVESGEFRFPISVCYGCLVSFPPDATDPDLPTPNCANVGTGSSGEVPCYVGQDEPIDCRVCQAQGGPTGLCLP